MGLFALLVIVVDPVPRSIQVWAQGGPVSGVRIAAPAVSQNRFWCMLDLAGLVVDKFYGQNFRVYPGTGGSPVWGPAGFIKLGPPAGPGWVVAKGQATVKRSSSYGLRLGLWVRVRG